MSSGAQRKCRISACDSSPHCIDCSGAQVTFTPAARGALWRLHAQPGLQLDELSPVTHRCRETAGIHGCSPNATIFYDCAFPLSTNEKDDNDLSLRGATSSQRRRRKKKKNPLSVSSSPRSSQSTASWRKGLFFPLPPRYKLNNSVTVWMRLQVSVASLSNLGEAVEDEQLLQAWRGSVAANTAHPMDGILIGPIQSDPRLQLQLHRRCFTPGGANI